MGYASSLPAPDENVLKRFFADYNILAVAIWLCRVSVGFGASSRLPNKHEKRLPVGSLRRLGALIALWSRKTSRFGKHLFRNFRKTKSIPSCLALWFEIKVVAFFVRLYVHGQLRFGVELCRKKLNRIGILFTRHKILGHLL